MKKWLIILLAIPSLGYAALNPPWEDFFAPNDDWLSGKTMSRMSVPHGWLVFSRHGVTGSTSTFIPDENHEWVLEPSLTKTLVKPEAQ